jgi:hypothetical protein
MRQAVFVVGPSRSGTALLRSALNRHPDVFLAGETHYFDDLRPRLSAPSSASLAAEERLACEDYFLALAHRPYGHGGVAAQSRMDRAQLRCAADALGGGADAYFQAYCLLARKLEQPGSDAPSVWGEKTPRHVFRIPEILDRFPRAQVVCLVRDPRAVVASYRDWRNQGGFDLDDDAGHTAALEMEARRTMASYDPTIASLLWRATASAGRRARQRFGPNRVTVVRYEDVTADPESALRELAMWLGLEFGKTMLDVPLHNSTFSAFDRSAGISTAPVTRWRRMLAPTEVAIVQAWCGREMDRLGYIPEPVSLAPRQRAALVGSLPVAVARAAVANHRRMGRVGPYLWRRARLLLPG